MWFFYISTGIYVIVIAFVIAGITKKNLPFKTSLSPSIKFDILVPFKNEAKNLPCFIEGLLRQSYPKELYRVIFIDDHSDDNSYNLAHEALPNFSNSILITSTGYGKKQALISGMKYTTNSHILMTDADTVAEPDWILSHALAFETQKCDFVIGSIKMEGGNRSLFNLLQKSDYKIINAITQGTAKLGHPTMCSGANMSFLKSRVPNYAEVIKQAYSSGDDMFLLEHFKRNKLKISTTISNYSTVKIKPEKLGSFLKQRMRWAGKSTGYTDYGIITFGALIAIQNIAILALFALWILNIFSLKELVIITSIKWLSDTILLMFSHNKCSLRHLFIGSVLFVIYPFYSVASLAGGFILQFTQANKSTL